MYNDQAIMKLIFLYWLIAFLKPIKLATSKKSDYIFSFFNF
ncbi:hypothetical Protein psc5_07740 [Candidatus Phytoplasma solani]